MPGQTPSAARPGGRVSVPALLRALLAVAVTVSALGACSERSARDAAVVLTGVREVTVVVDGAAHAARDGERLPAGAAVRTGPGGAATLTVLGRRVLLGPATAVRVPNGVELALDAGDLLVDRRRGPGLDVVAGAVTVDDIGRGAVRIDRGYSLGVAVYSGSARMRTSTGRQLAVPRLHRAVASARSLPSRATPLSLRHDAWERLAIGRTVDSDIALARLATVVDATYRPGGVTVPAVFGTAPVGARPSEVVLPVAIAAAASGGTPTTRLRARATDLHRAGGSWGVVAALLGTEASPVAAALEDLTTAARPVAVVPGERPRAAGRVRPTPRPQPGRTPTALPTPGPTDPTTPGETPTKSSEPTPSEPSLVDRIRRLLPTPTTVPVVGDLLD